MQILIDIPEKLACEGFERSFTEEEKNILIKAIGNGTPLTEVLEDIKTDIEGLKHEHTDVSGYRWWDNAINNALSIIDRHIGEGSE